MAPRRRATASGRISRLFVTTLVIAVVAVTLAGVVSSPRLQVLASPTRNDKRSSSSLDSSSSTVTKRSATTKLSSSLSSWLRRRWASLSLHPSSPRLARRGTPKPLENLPGGAYRPYIATVPGIDIYKCDDCSGVTKGSLGWSMADCPDTPDPNTRSTLQGCKCHHSAPESKQHSIPSSCEKCHKDYTCPDALPDGRRIELVVCQSRWKPTPAPVVEHHGGRVVPYRGGRGRGGGSKEEEKLSRRDPSALDVGSEVGDGAGEGGGQAWQRRADHDVNRGGARKVVCQHAYQAMRANPPPPRQ